LKQRQLHPDEVSAGYQALAQLYPYVPSLLLWRGWEFAAYRRYALPEPSLDVGCGDGRFFRLLWPQIRDVVGVDSDPQAAEAARQSGVYRGVYVAPAHQLPLDSATFSSAFANCSLEHMDNLTDVLGEIYRCLCDGGVFVFSVITDTLIEWLTRSPSMDDSEANSLQDEFVSYHHIVNALSIDEWISTIHAVGFRVVECTPIIPEKTGRLFSLLDAIWHSKVASGEIGQHIYRYLQSFPQFPSVFSDVLQYILRMEEATTPYGGAVFLARKPSE
jgi:SAM-dependent methyltransferase